MGVDETGYKANAVDDSHDRGQDDDENSKQLANSLYEGPLDHVIRNNPNLFVAPRYWTNRHSELLRVDCREGWRWTSSQVEPSYATEEHEHEDLARHDPKEIQHHTSPGDSSVGISVSGPVSAPVSAHHADNGMLRVPRFHYPRIEPGQRSTPVQMLISGDTSYPCQMDFMGCLLIEDTPMSDGL